MRARFPALAKLCSALLAAAFISSAGSAFAQEKAEWYVGKPIKSISFDGLKHVKRSELDGIVGDFVGRLFSDEAFWDLQGRLYSLEFFDSIMPTAVPADEAGTAVILKFAVQEKPVVSKVEFSGNAGLRRNELLDVVAIKANEVANGQKIKADEQAIRAKYLEKGYTDVRVRSSVSEPADGAVVVTFTVDEGEMLALEAFRFEGNEAFSEKTLRALLSLKTKSLFNDGAFQEAKLVADTAAVVSYYRERGYVDAAVEDVARESRKDEQGKNLLTLAFRIKEGRQYTFAGVEFEGNVIFPADRLRSLVSLKPGQVLNFKRLEADFQRVADLYYENGYIQNSFSRRESRDEDAGSISYRVSVVERGRAYIDNIIVRGNERTKDEVILREIPLQEGDIFSKSKVIDGLRNLYNLQYFSSVVPEPTQGKAENLMDLVFTVEEQPTADIQFGVTFSGVSTPGAFPVSGLVKWNEKNFLGSGNIFGVEVTGAPDAQRASIQYTERWLFGLPLSGGFDLTVNHQSLTAAQDSAGPVFNGDEAKAFPDPYKSWEEYEAANKLVPAAYLMPYQQLDFSLGFSSGYRFSTLLGNLTVSGGLRTKFIRNSYDSVLYRPFDPGLRAGNETILPSNSVWSSVALDQRDVFYDPSRGYFASQRASFVGLLPAEKERFVRTDTKAEVFFTLFDVPLSETFNFKTVLGIHSGLSFLLPQVNGQRTVNEASKLYIDGMFIGRGWYLGTNRNLALWENWAELRTPLAPGILAWDWFFDAAAVKDKPETLFSSLSMEDFRFSFGGGLRFTIQQFPFRFLFAKRFYVEDGEVKWMPGSMWRNADDPTSGLDFVISFAIPTY